MNIDQRRQDSDSSYDSASSVPEREISLGTATILGIFLALALVCAAFFGFGYSLGRRSAASTAIATDTKPVAAPEPASDSPFSHFKTAPAPAPAPVSSTDSPEAATVTRSEDAPTPVAHRPAEVQPTHSAIVPVPTAAATATPSPAATDPATSTTGQFVVQISAPSRQSDADALLAALINKGYRAYIRREPQDSFYHVQVGPYPTRQDAQAMSKRLDADGYKPFIK